MRSFTQREIAAARAYAVDGGQALHLFSGAIADAIRKVRRIPTCFRGRRELAHLFDQDRQRLEQTARRLGVRVIKVEYPGTSSQHVDLCGKPLERAKAEAQLQCARQSQP